MITITREQIIDYLVKNELENSDYYFYSDSQLDESNPVVKPRDFANFVLNHKSFREHLTEQFDSFVGTGRFDIFPYSFDSLAFLSKIAKDYPNYKLIRKEIKDRVDKIEKERKNKISFILHIQELEDAGYKVIPPPQKNKKKTQ